MKDKISFIIPIFNDKIDDIKKCIESIKSQNINYEIILINDGSSDTNIDSFCKKIITGDVKYIYQKNQGSAAARNNGLKHATGSYIVFVDADDDLKQNFFDSVRKKWLAEITIFDYSYNDDDNCTNYSISNREELRNKQNIYSNIMFFPEKIDNFMLGAIWGKIFSAKFLRENKILFCEKLRKSQDRVFMLECFLKCSNYSYYPIPMYNYRMNKNSITHKYNMRMIDYYYSLLEEFKKIIKKNNIDKECAKFLNYNIVNELLPLSIFNKKHNKSYIEIKKELIQLLKKFEFNDFLNKIKISDIKTKKGKIKLILYKLHFYYLIYLFFVLKNK